MSRMSRNQPTTTAMESAFIRGADLIASPWKNGGGVTREIAAYPHGAGFDTFIWRVSLADVTRGHLRLLLSGPASSAGRPMPDGRTPEPETPYQKAQQVWDERLGSARVQARSPPLRP